ncbi:MAG: CPBP family intramembrane metalloprotease [Lactobacillus sp.]|nr:CPBP family intramembrane metalloprotease [Lactobacillus sp.]MCI2033749.1 CPBP family intramembrane metalloprotease [Lactobacillus sp.]
MTNWHPVAHLGRKTFLSYLFAFLIGFALMVPVYGIFNLSEDAFGNLFTLVIAAILWLFTWRWLHLPLFARPQNAKLGWLAVAAIIASNCLDLGPLPAPTVARLGNAFINGFAPGFSEELLFRGPLLWWLWTKTPKKWDSYWWTSITTALAFGAIHFSNLSIQPDLVQTTLQVGYAAVLGFAAAAIFFTTHNLWFTIVMHSLFDAVAAYGDPAMVSQVGFDWWSLTSLAIMIMVELAIGIVYLRRLPR